MAPSVTHRLAPVNYAKQFINAINFIRQQKQIPNFERILRCFQRYSDISSDLIKKHLNSAVSDGLILEYTAIGFKGQRTGLEQEGYRVPNLDEVELEDDGHDWYCFECHGPGEVYECSDCFRVYHKFCTVEDPTRGTFTCSTCKACKRKSVMKKKLLNTLLSYTILHLREKTRDLYKIDHKVYADDFRRFVYREMDLSQMEQKVQTSTYRCMEEFLADAQAILHNCFLVFGEEKGNLTEVANIMMKACKYDLDEIEICPSCYYMSNAKPEDWFSQPCNPPHELVYAKQKGYSYWPAKVMKDMGGKFDVRFFGGWHERAVLPAENVKPISTDIRKLAVKKSGGFQKSMLELKKYQAILKGSDKKVTDSKGTEKEMGDNCEKKEVNQDTSFKEQKLEEKKYSKKSKSLERGIFQSQNRNASKRKRESMSDNIQQPEDEAANRQVTSTSVESLAKKQTKNWSKNSNNDEAYTVTSSFNKVTNNNHIPTVSTAVQTYALQTCSVSAQTDIKTESSEMDRVIASDFPKPAAAQNPDLQLSDKIWEERIATAMTSLAKRLKKQYEEEKKLALRQLSHQLEEDFGKDKQQAVERTIASMKLEVEKARKLGEDKAKEQYMEEMKKLAAKHKDTISQIKKKQWCQFCEEEAMYHCCWNTSYCSVKCQQEHWHKEHKRVCRRKRTQEC